MGRTWVKRSELWNERSGMYYINWNVNTLAKKTGAKKIDLGL